MEGESLYTQTEKIEICKEIATRLKEFEGPQGKVNLYNDSFSFVPQLKALFKEYIHGNTFFKGTLSFEEINKQINYHLPLTKNHSPLFVIRILT